MSLSTINVLIFISLLGLLAFGRGKGNGCPATRDVPLPYGLLAAYESALQFFVGDADEVSDVMAIECETESEWTFHSEIDFCREHVPVLPFATGHALGFVTSVSKDADLVMKLVKTKLLDLDADNPHANVHAPVGVACVSEDADQGRKLPKLKLLDPDADDPRASVLDLVGVACVSKDADQGPKLPKLKLLDLDADNPRASVLDLSGRCLRFSKMLTRDRNFPN